MKEGVVTATGPPQSGRCIPPPQSHILDDADYRAFATPRKLSGLLSEADQHTSHDAQRESSSSALISQVSGIGFKMPSCTDTDRAAAMEAKDDASDLDQYQSLNFERVLSAVWRDQHLQPPVSSRSKHNQSHSPDLSHRSYYRTINTALTGVLVGIVGFSVTKAISALTDVRSRVTRELYHRHSPTAGVCFFVLWNLALVILSSVPVIYWARGAKGSGPYATLRRLS